MFIKTKHLSLKKKMILVCSTLIIIVSIVIALGSFMNFSNIYSNRSKQYIGDTTRQITNNLENNVNTIEKITFDILKNSVIQQELKKTILTDYEQNLQDKRFEEQLSTYALFDENVVSLSVISTNGSEFTIKKDIYTPVTKMFQWDEIVNAKGSTLWTVSDDELEQICVARAILDLSTMKPLGYINMVCEKEYFSSLIQDIAGTYSNQAYVVDEYGKIMCSNNGDLVGEFLPADVLDKDKERVVLNGIDSYIYYGEEIDNTWSVITIVPVNEIGKEISAFTLFVFALTTVSIIIGVIGIVLLTEKMIKPLQELIVSMKAIEKGDFTVRVAVSADDEIGCLGRQYNHMAGSIETLIEKVYKLELSQKQAEIEFLKMQINPHFLYNTLDTISWMARMENKTDIALMTTALADLLRATIKQESFITVREELKNVKNYLFIQEYRFGQKIKVHYEIAESINDYIIPNFILQPLVENAIIHGLETKLEPGMLIIKCYIFDECLHFQVIDDGIGMSQEEVSQLYYECKNQSSKNCIGIKNVYLRLKNYYGEESTLHIQSRKGKGTTIAFSIRLIYLNEIRKVEQKGEAYGKK